MKVKSVSDLAFRVLDELTDDEDGLWVAHIVFDGQAKRTGDIQRIMKKDCGISYNAVQLVLRELVSKNIIQRTSQGVYAPNLRMILDKMIETFGVEEEK
uniref:Putative antitoxin n=2 Tax=viral metagenome TaxID=1070528 RepID=A0A6M3MFM6_9ZZZZ